MSLSAGSPYQGQATIKQASVASSVEELDPIIGRLEDYAKRIAQCGDRLLGPRPSAVDNAEKAPEPITLIHAMQNRRSRLMRLADWLETEVQRVENGLS